MADVTTTATTGDDASATTAASTSAASSGGAGAAGADGADTSDSPLHVVAEAAKEQARAYAGGEDRPLSGYLVTMSVYGGLAAALGFASWRKGLPETVRPWDLTLLSLATFGLSRTLTKDSVTSPLRAPFTTYGGVSAPSELHEEVRSHGPVSHSIGELLTCPFCLGQWVATGFASGFVLAPRASRMAAATLSAVAVSDMLQHLYGVLQRASSKD